MNEKTRVAVASRSFSAHPMLRKGLLERYSMVSFNDAGKTLTGEKLIEFLKNHEKAIIGLEVMNEATLLALPELKVISKYGVGLDTLDLIAMNRLGIRLGWTGGVNKRSVAEMVISSAISLLHRVPEANYAVRDGKWRQIRGNQLTGKTAGIIGCGHVGKDVAILLQPFNCRILANDILDFPEFYSKNQVKRCDLEELLRQSDVVTIHLPLDESTRDIINSKRLELMKPGAFLINMARGNLVDEPKLFEMLKCGRLGGAAVDVLAQEPPENWDLLNLPNVIATPHIGGSTEEAVLSMGSAAIDGLDQAKLPSEIETLKVVRD